ncbi:MAG: flagellar biosynthetic protein FliO [Lachnospiraceae bacterium]|jgi:flagellar protein FliO/FliZ|nr:flagellar biosynthetic protein FliO [Lachnospiraceae bacterium]
MAVFTILSGLASVFRLIGVLLVFLFVLAVTYATTKWIAHYQQGIAANRNIQVIETFRITNNKFIQIIQVGERYLVISVCKDTINILTEITEDELVWKPSNEEEGDRSGINSNFQEILENLKKKLPRK